MVRADGKIELSAYSRESKIPNMAGPKLIQRPNISVTVTREQFNNGAGTLFSEANRWGFNQLEMGLGLIGYGLENAPGAKKTVEWTDRMLERPEISTRQSLVMVFGAEEDNGTYVLQNISVRARTPPAARRTARPRKATARTPRPGFWALLLRGVFMTSLLRLRGRPGEGLPSGGPSGRDNLIGRAWRNRPLRIA